MVPLAHPETRNLLFTEKSQHSTVVWWSHEVLSMLCVCVARGDCGGDEGRGGGGERRGGIN